MRNFGVTRSEAEWLVNLIESNDEACPFNEHLSDELRDLFGMIPREGSTYIREKDRRSVRRYDNANHDVIPEEDLPEPELIPVKNDE